MGKLENSIWNVLDHGFVRVVDTMGDDSSIVQAARVSYGEGTKTPSTDQKLISYLWRNRHTSPFEMVELKLHVKCPIFVARQWLRHRTANVNEYSGRYSVMSPDFYLPKVLHKQGTSNKQKGGEEHPDSESRLYEMRLVSEAAYSAYEKMLSMGISREEARMVLPVNFYTEFYWKIDLSNLLNFVRLRNDSHAQYEIQQYADIIEKIVATWVPMTYMAYVEEKDRKSNFGAL